MKFFTKPFFFLLSTFLFFKAQAQPIVQITLPSQEVTSTYVRVDGTASGVTKPMWYEVFQGTTAGKMTDFGAFKQGANWFFIARHLSAGANVVKVYGANESNQITSSNITLTIFQGGTPMLRPRPMPAELWWGGLADNAQLQQNPDQWSMVKKYADAYFFHTAIWGDDKNALMQSIIQQSESFGTKFVAELGGGTGTDDGWPQWQHNAWGAGENGFIVNRYNKSGLILSEATHDFQPNWQPFAKAYPSFSEAQCVDKMTNYWMDYFLKNHAVFPHLKSGVTQSPVWWRWRTFPSLHAGTEADDFSANGRQYHFDMAMVMENFVNKTRVNNQSFAFYSDFPWYTMVWGEPATTAIGNTGTEGWVAREKQRNYELFLHENNALHTAVVNEDPGGELMNSDPAEWNRQFSKQSMKSLYLQQREGHRPNRFVFESWYFGGTPARAFPTVVTPESDPNSYTGLARQGIKYLKGIKDETGALETLQLTKSTSGNTTTFALKNTGDIACMPALAAIETGDNGVTTQWLDASNINITAAVKSADGWVYTPLLQPDATISIRCVVTGEPSTAKQIMLEAFWNPQDPTGLVRDRQILTLGLGTPQTPYDGIIAIPGTIEAENFDTGGEGVAYHDMTPTNLSGAYRSEGVDLEACSDGGYNLNGSAMEEWTEYTIQVNIPGRYRMDARVASATGGSFHMEVDDTDVTGMATVPNTGGGQNWQTVTKTINLTAGQHVLRFHLTEAEFNTDKFVFTFLGNFATGVDYRFVSRLSGLALDVKSCSDAHGANVQQNTINHTNCQRWKIEAVEGEFYKITSQQSPHVLEVVSASTTQGANVQQGTWSNSTAQQWKIEPTNNGYYRLVARHSNQVLTVADCASTPGANGQQSPWNGTNCQQWKLELVTTPLVTGLEAIAKQVVPSLKLSPNPAGGQVNVAWEGLEADGVVLTVVNAQGQTMLQRALKHTSALQLDTTPWSSGIYIVMVRSGHSIQASRLVVSR
ncbi:MAG: RICIN domain-containing protein [Bacteroidota bacterium]